MHLHEADHCIGLAAVCRHQVPQCAVNLYKTGERYAYSHYLLTAHILPNRAPAFLSQDIACKHKVWRHKVEEALQRPASHNCAKEGDNFLLRHMSDRDTSMHAPEALEAPWPGKHLVSPWNVGSAEHQRRR